jgi:hypothetical protein
MFHYIRTECLAISVTAYGISETSVNGSEDDDMLSYNHLIFLMMYSNVGIVSSSIVVQMDHLMMD